MNKKAFLDDWGDLAWFTLVIVFVLGIFFIFTKLNSTAIDKAVQNKDIQIQREDFLIDYLKTPIRQTQFATKKDSLIYDAHQRELASNLLINDLTIGDVFALIETDKPAYVNILGQISLSEPSFVSHNVMVIYSNGVPQIINPGKCNVGKTSSAAIPTLNKKTITVVVRTWFESCGE